MTKEDKDNLKAFAFNVKDLVKKHKEKMEKNYHIDYSNGTVEASCLHCGKYTERLLTKAKTKKEALDKVINGEGFCDKCFIDVENSVYNKW